MTCHADSPARRRLLLASAAALGLHATGARADLDVGPARPRLAPPDIRLRRHDNRAATLAEQLRGGCTAVQLMFTGCSAVCPLQGALFASLQARLAKEGMTDVRLLSLSIDPLGDDPAALRGWLKRYGAGPAWSASVPAMADLEPMLSLLGRSGGTVGDRHTGKLGLFDREGRLAWRTAELPPVGEVIDALKRVRL